MSEQKTKVDSLYEDAMVLVAAMLGGEDKIPTEPAKLPESELAPVIEKVLKKRQDQVKNKVEEDATKLLDEMLAYSESVEKAKKEFEQKVQDQKKILADKVKNLANQIKGINELKTRYIQTLRGSVEGGLQNDSTIQQ